MERFAWGDCTSGESDDDIEEQTFDDKPEIMKIPESHIDSDEVHCCRLIPNDFSDIESTLLLALTVYQDLKIRANLFCRLNELRSASSVVLSNWNLSSDEHLKFNLSDSFLKARHEVFFSNFVSLFSLDATKSDVKFCDVLPIQSERTPDFIQVEDKNVHVVEITVGSYYEKAMASKGDTESGYQSKYHKEIKELTEEGFNVRYYVLAFEMKGSNKEYQSVITKISSELKKPYNREHLNYFETIRLEMSATTRALKTVMSGYWSLLFVDDIEIKIDYGWVDSLIQPFIYNDSHYQKVSCSSRIYNSIKVNMEQLTKVLDRMLKHGDNMKHNFCYDVYQNRFRFYEDFNGYSAKEWYDVFCANDLQTIITNMGIVRNNEPINYRMKSDIEYFVRIDSDFDFLKTTGNLPSYFEKHENTGYLTVNDIACSFNSRLLRKTIMKSRTDTKMIYEDEAYEDKLFDAIREFDAKYENIKQFDELIESYSDKMMVGSVVTESKLDSAIKEYTSKLIELNNLDGKQIIVPHQKQPFLYPVISVTGYISYNEKPFEFLTNCLKMVDTAYTRQILVKSMSVDFKFGTIKSPYNPAVEEKLREISQLTEAHRRIVKNKAKELGLKKLNREQMPKTEEQDKIRSIMRTIKKSEMPRGRLPVVKVNCNPKTMTGKSFHDQEMSHYKEKKSKSVYKGVGLLESFEQLCNEYDQFKEYLMSDSGVICPDSFMDMEVGEDVPVLMDLKKMYIGQFKDKIEMFKRTNLYHITAVISRFCHTLMYYSQVPLKSEQVAVDTLGLENFVVFIRGGEKIFKTKKSKMYRYICKIPESLINWYSRSGLDGDFKIHTIEGKHYLITPWQQMHETVLVNGICALYKIWGFITLSTDTELDHKISIDKCLINCLLFLHNRRKTEVMLHSLRYITFNVMADYAKVDKMLPTLAGFNTDSFQSFLRQCICNRFSKYSKSLREFKFAKKGAGIKLYGVQTLFNNNLIEDNKELASNIYSSYIMSKAPVNSTIEQITNLQGIMEIKNEFDSELKSLDRHDYINTQSVTIEQCEGDLIEYGKRMMSGDFKYDPKYICTMGHFMADYISSLVSPAEMQTIWLNILNKGMDTMANTSGLRGVDPQDFFNNKGHTIVYKEILKDTEAMREQMEIIGANLDENIKRQKAKGGKVTFLMVVNKVLGAEGGMMFKPTFHVVDKLQKGGNREIYVMDYHTKSLQQPIESFLAALNSYLPNEYISVPSNKRLQLIHSLNFDGVRDEDTIVMNWVLDCKKWAPKALVIKFIEMIWSGRSKYPPSAVDYMIFFFERLHFKKVFIKEHIFEVLKSNLSNVDYIPHFVKDEERGGYYIEMTNSWMMGIFNHMSSYMHAANTLYANYIISTSAKLNLGKESHLKIIVHSDDSGGNTHNTDDLTSHRQIYLYEINLHACNHLISDKKFNLNKSDTRDPSDIIEGGQVKSVIRSDYFEVLSVLYVDKELLPLVAKIFGGFDFHPTDKGYCFDICEAYSKCIDFILNGATHQQAYLAMKIHSQMIHRFYFSEDISEIDRNLPNSFFGAPDAHPLLVLLCGTDSDNIRLYHVQGKDKFNMYRFINMNIIFDDLAEPYYINMPSATPNVKLNNNLKSLKEQNAKDVEEFQKLGNWVCKNLKTNNSYYNALQFLIQLNDKTFISALQDESVVRRISRSFWFRKAKCYNTKFSLMSISEIRDIQRSTLVGLKTLDIKMAVTEKINELIKDYEKWNENDKNVFKLINAEPIRLIEYFENIKYKNIEMKSNRKTTKPVTMTMQKNLYISNTDFIASNLVIWMKEPEKRWMVENFSNYNNIAMEVESFLKELGVEVKDLDYPDLFKVCSSLKDKNVKSYSFYSNMPSQMRNIGTYSEFLHFLSHNSFRNKQLEGLVSPFGKTISAPLATIMPEFEDQNIQSDMSFLFVAESLMQSSDKNFEHYKNMKFKEYGGNISDYKCMLERISKEVNTSERLKPFLNHVVKVLMRDLNDQPTPLNFDDIDDGFYHCFIKSQTLRGNVWVGHGVLFIAMGDCYLILHINGKNIDSVTSNKSYYLFDNRQIGYLDYILKHCEIDPIRSGRHLIQSEKFNSVEQMMGMNKRFQLCIDEEKHLNMIIPEFNHDISMEGFLSFLKSSIFKPIGRNKYEVENFDGFGRRRNYSLIFLPIEASNIISKVEEMTKIKENDWIIPITGENDLVTILCRDGFDLPLFVNKNDLYYAYHATKIFKIMSSVAKRSPNDAGVNKITEPPIYPAPKGGFLNLMIKYKEEIDPGFGFNWKIVVSPELMALRANQPEAFVVNLMTDIREKYSKLYDGEQRAEIEEKMCELATSINSKDSDLEILKVLKRWGNIGVSGALESLKKLKSSANFNKFCFLTRESSYLLFYRDSWLTIIKAIMECLMDPSFKIYNSEYEDAPFFRIKTDKNGIIKTLIHGTVMSYSSTVNEPHSMSSVDLWVYKALDSIMKNEKITEKFEKLIEEDPMLCNLPVGDKTIVEWQVTYNSCKYNSSLSNKIEEPYDYRKLRSLENNPSVKTVSVLSEIGISSNAKPYYGGAFDPKFMKKLKDGIRFEHKRTSLKLRCDFVEASYEKIPLMKGYIPMWPIDEDYLDGDDWYDVKIELTSDEPDDSALEDGFPNIEYKDPTEPKKRYLNYKGKKVIETEYVFTTLVKPSANYINWHEEMIQLGDYAIIITDCLHEIALETNYDVYKMNHEQKPESMFDPGFYFIYVRHRNEIPKNAIEEFLNCKFINKNLLRSQLNSNKYKHQMWQGRIISDEPISYEEKEERIQEAIKKIKNPDLKPEEEVERLVSEAEAEGLDFVSNEEKVRQRMIEMGFTKNAADSLLKKWQKHKNTGRRKDMEMIMKDIFEGRTKLGDLKSSIKRVLTGVKERKDWEMINVVPSVFGQVRDNTTKRRSSSLKDPELIAEIGSLSEDVMNRLLSGTLSISERKKKYLNMQCKLWQRASFGIDMKKRIGFITRLIYSLMADANVVNDSKDDDMWRSFEENCQELITEDMDKNYDPLEDENFYDDSDQPDVRLKYKRMAVF